MKTLTKIDKFYWILALVLLILSILVIFTLRAIFDAMDTANTIDPKILENDAIRINQSKLDQAQEVLENKEFTPLDLR